MLCQEEKRLFEKSPFKGGEKEVESNREEKEV
jgi:hypothetical protein